MAGVPALSVVMAALNAERHISRAIRSVLDQTMEDFEFVIVDDGSTDRTAEVVRGFDDRRIHLFHNERNLGISTSLNRGIGLARADRIARIDADDQCLRDRFAAQMRFLDENPRVGLVGGWWLLFHGEKILTNREPATHAECIAQLANAGALSAHSSFMFRKSTISKNIRYDERLSAAQDYKLCADLFQHTNFANLQRVVVNVYRTPGSITATRQNLQERSAVKTHQKILCSLLGSEVLDRFPDEFSFATDPHAEAWVTVRGLADFYDALYSNSQGSILQLFLRSRFRAMIRDKLGQIILKSGSSLRHPVGRMVLRYRVKKMFVQQRARI